MITSRLNIKLFASIASIPCRQLTKMQKSGASLKSIIEKLEHYAPLEYAEKWDNVGLLLEPYEERPIKTIFLTNDLTVKVAEEAVVKNADLIITYHPLLFAPFKRIVKDNFKGNIVSMCLGKGIAVYSPHTAWDCAPLGASLNNWLSTAFPRPSQPGQPIFVNPDTKAGPGLCWSYSSSTYKLRQVIEDIQKFIGLPVQVAMGVDHSLDTIVNSMACCAGSGASLLKNVNKIDVYVTGEMSHHELLDAQHRNLTVILCNHSNTERGFLKHFQPILDDMLMTNCNIIVSEVDKDPLETFFLSKKE